MGTYNSGKEKLAVIHRYPVTHCDSCYSVDKVPFMFHVLHRSFLCLVSITSSHFKLTLASKLYTNKTINTYCFNFNLLRNQIWKTSERNIYCLPHCFGNIFLFLLYPVCVSGNPTTVRTAVHELLAQRSGDYKVTTKDDYKTKEPPRINKPCMQNRRKKINKQPSWTKQQSEVSSTTTTYWGAKLL